MIEITLHPSLLWITGRSDVRQSDQEDTGHGWQGKSADIRRADMAGRVGDVRHRAKSSAGAFSETLGKSMFPAPSLVPSAWSFQ